jgi:hypothetical protein
MRRNEQTIFYLEDLRESWLSTRLRRWLSRAGIFIGSGLIGGLFGALVSMAVALLTFTDMSITMKVVSGLAYGMIIGACIGLVAGMIGAFTELRPVERIQISLTSMSRLQNAMRVSLITGLSSGLIFALIYTLVFGQSGMIYLKLTSKVWLHFYDFRPSGGFRTGLVLGLSFGLIRLLTSQQVESRRNPNQGTRRSMKLALLTGLIFGLVGMFIAMLRSLGVVVNAVGAALISGMVSGGLFSVRHFVMRLILWSTRSAPLDYVRFLDFSAERLFLRKVGGGYIFVHRMLLEYFASLRQQPSPNTKADV